MTETLLQGYVGGAVITAILCTAMERAFHAPQRLTMRIRATLFWPLFWISFIWAFFIEKE